MPERRTRPNPVKSRRQALDWTQADLARRAGMAQASVCGIERGRRLRLHLDSVDALAQALGVRTGELADELLQWNREQATEGAAA